MKQPAKYSNINGEDCGLRQAVNKETGALQSREAGTSGSRTIMAGHVYFCEAGSMGSCFGAWLMSTTLRGPDWTTGLGAVAA